MTDRKQTSFNVDENTLKLTDELKQEFGVTSSAAVLKRALALSRIAVNTQIVGQDSISRYSVAVRARGPVNSKSTTMSWLVALPFGFIRNPAACSCRA